MLLSRKPSEVVIGVEGLAAASFAAACDGAAASESVTMTRGERSIVELEGRTRLKQKTLADFYCTALIFGA